MTPSETIRSTVTDDGVVLLDVRNGKIFNSNGVGARIWLKLQEGLDVATIVAQIGAEFSLSTDLIRPDVEEFVRKLKENGIVDERSCADVNGER
jgi:Coenzyme PQQ synthesis protein D (PqqD)